MTEVLNTKPLDFTLDIAVLADGVPVGFSVVPDSVEYALADDALGSLSLAEAKMGGTFTATTDAVGPQEIHVKLGVLVDGGKTLTLEGVGSFDLVAAPAEPSEPVLSGQITFVFAAQATEANPT